MLEKTLALLAPHYCCACDKIGNILCHNCKYNIICEQSPVCINCKRPTVKSWLCKDCKTPFERAWVANERKGALQRLIGLYKFERTKAAYKPLGDILLYVLPELPINTVIVPIPTTPSRIRERGYDHIMLIARYVAKYRGLKCQQIIKRVDNTKQRQSSAVKRASQAKNAFLVGTKLSPDTPYLLLDDVITTGATIKYASKALKKAGAKHVWVAVIARQVLNNNL